MDFAKSFYLFGSLVTLVHSVEVCIFWSAWTVQTFNNKKISQSMMWTRNNLTKGECLMECYKEKYCVSFHFSPLLSTCIALRERFEGVSIETEDAPGFLLLQTMKPLPVTGSDCELDVDCASMTNSHCKDKLCKCDIGHGMDETTCRKLTECNHFSNTFTVYEGFVTWGNDIDNSGGKTLATCQQMCIDNANCQAADFSIGTNDCWIDGKTWFDLPSGDRGTSEPNYHLSQRYCSW